MFDMFFGADLRCMMENERLELSRLMRYEPWGTNTRDLKFHD
jgi:hypothetical protein